MTSPIIDISEALRGAICASNNLKKAEKYYEKNLTYQASRRLDSARFEAFARFNYARGELLRIASRLAEARAMLFQVADDINFKIGEHDIF